MQENFLKFITDSCNSTNVLKVVFKPGMSQPLAGVHGSYNHLHSTKVCVYASVYVYTPKAINN